jgi:hypothetical protein
MAIPAITITTGGMGSIIRARYAILAAAGLLAILVLSLSWPRFQASFRYLPVDIAINRYYADREIPSDRLAILVGFAQQAIGYHDHYRYHDGLSLLHYLQAIDPYTPGLERRPAYRLAESEAIASLRLAPAQAATWLRLATIRWILHDEPEDIIGPWKMSIFTGRTISTQFAYRVDIGLSQREFMDAEAVSMLRDQLLLGWRSQQRSLVQILARRDRNLVVTRELLADTDPLALADMETWLEKYR